MLASADATPVHVTGSFQIGTPLTTVVYDDDPDIAYSLALQIASGDTLTLDLATGIVTGTVAGTYQVETATAAGSITLTGNATVTVTSPLVTGSPLAVSVAVTNADTAATWAGKVRTALGLVTAITDHYTVGGSSTTITLTALAKAANDATLNIALANGTCTGITAAATSADTTAGVAASMAYKRTGAVWDATDHEGVALATATKVYGVAVACDSASSGIADIAGIDKTTLLNASDVDFSVSKAGLHPWTATTVTFTAASGNIVVYLDIQAGT